MSSLTVKEDQKWLPTHVQVTVLRGRGLRGKGKHGTSDVYTIIQLGKEKYSTCVAEKTTEPEWREECSFEVQPGVLESGFPSGSNELVLTVMHRALIGMDVFLGQAVIPLDQVFMESRSRKNEWYRLNSKTGKKEKERGDIQASIQFTRNNLTASMYDLVMKDKSASTFSKLKEHMKGKRRSSEKDSSSAVLPSGYGSMYRMRQRMPSEGGGEEDYEDDEGGEVRRSKMRTFFLRGKLRKSSDTRSSTSLGSESSESSSRGGSLSPTAGISVVVSDLSNSASNSSNLTADNSPEHTANTSPKLSPLKSDFGEITIAVPQPAVYVNGNHAYGDQTLNLESREPVGTLGLGLTQKTLPLSISLQNLSPRACTEPPGLVGDGRRWSFDKPCEEEKAAIAAALEKSGPMFMEEEQSGHVALTETVPSFCAWTSEGNAGEEQRRNTFSNGKSESAGKSSESKQASAATEERHRSWFGLRDSHIKPSLVVSPTLESSTDPHPLPFNPIPHLPGPLVDPASVGSPLYHTNPFCPSQGSQPPLSPCNPFFTFNHNPFYKDMPTSERLNRSLPPLPYLSSARPPITQIFPELSDQILTSTRYNPESEDSTKRDEVEILGQNPLFVKEEKTPLSKKSPNPFTPVQDLEVHSQWDDSFEAFAAGRLQSPEDFTADGRKSQNPFRDLPPHHSSCEGVLPSIEEDDYDTKNEQWYQASLLDTSTHRLDSFPAILETIPENMSDTSATCSSSNDKDLSTCATNDSFHSKDSSHIMSTQLGGSSSPDPSSSGLGSLAEDDYLSCLSAHSDKLYASSDEAESSILCFEKLNRASISIDFADTSNDLSLLDAVQQTVIQYEDVDQNEVYLNSVEASLDSPEHLHPKAVIPLKEMEIEVIDSTLPNISLIGGPFASLEMKSPNSSQPEKFPKDLNCSAHLSANATNSYTLPSFYITTSSPDTKQQKLNASIEETGAEFSDAKSFVDLCEYHNSYSLQGSDSTFLHTQVSFKDLNVSGDSQDYQSCESQPSSKCSSVTESLHLANSTLPGEATALPGAGLEVFNTTKSYHEEANQSFAFDWTQDVNATLKQCLTKGALPAPINNPHSNSNLKYLSEGEEEHLCVSINALPQRSKSEGTLAPFVNSLPSPIFGSDPGAIQDSPLAHAGPELPFLTSSPFLLTPESSSFPNQLRTLPFLANASASFPPSAVQAASPMPMTQDTDQQQQAANPLTSPHPVKPLTAPMLIEEKRSVLATGLEKLKSTINPGRSSQSSEQEVHRKKYLTEGAGSYYHLTHSELVSLLVQREGELGRQKAEFENQKLLLSKREVELRRLKPQIRDLEDYIDTLLVRIMEQKPTLLQVGSKLK